MDGIIPVMTAERRKPREQRTSKGKKEQKGTGRKKDKLTPQARRLLDQLDKMGHEEPTPEAYKSTARNWGEQEGRSRRVRTHHPNIDPVDPNEQ